MFEARPQTWGRALAALMNRQARRANRRPRLALEALESRLTPTTYTWSQTAPGAFSWNDPANWGGAGFPNAPSDVANLTAALAGNETVNLNVPVTLGTLNVGSSTSPFAFTVAASGGSLTFRDPSGTAALNETNQGGDALNAPVTLLSAWTVNVSASSPLTVGGTVAANNHPIALASGTLVLNAAASNAGAVTVAPGATLAGTGAVAQAPDLLVAASFFDSAVYEFNAATGSLYATLVAPYTSALLSGPAGVTVGPDGNLYISSQFNNSVLEYNVASGSLSTFLSSSVLGPVATADGDAAFAPAGLRFGPDGNLYVSLNGGQTATSGGAVVRFDITSSSGGVLSYGGTYANVATGLIQPSGLTFGTASGDTGNLYVSNSALSDVVKVTGATTATPTSATFVASGSGGLDFPAGLTFGPDGKLYVVDLGATTTQGNVLRYNADGTFDRVFTPSSGPGSLAFQFPSDALFDPQGHLDTANLGPAYPPNLAGSINQYNGDGTFGQTLVDGSQFTSTGTGTSGIAPSQLAYLPAPPLTVNGTLNPGGASTPGTFTAGNVTFAPTGSFAVAVNSATPGTGYGQLVSTGTVRLNNATLNVSLGYQAAVGDQLDLVTDSANPVVGTFAGLPERGTLNLNGQLFAITYHGGASGHDVVLTRLPASFSLSGFPSVVTAGTPFSITVTAQDGQGGVATGYTGTVRLAATDGNATLPAAYTFTTADAGVHVFSGVILRTAGAQFVVAYDNAHIVLDGVAPVTVVAAAPDHLSFNEPATVTAGTPFQISVTVQDAYNNTVTGYLGAVHFTASNGAQANYTFQPADLGTRTFTIATYRAGTLGVTGTDMTLGISGGTSFTVVPAAADHLVFLQQPTDTAAGQPLSPVAVAIVDAYGNVETGDNSDTVTLSLGVNPGGGVLSGTLTMTVSGGVATFGDLSIDQPGVGYTLHATVGGTIPDLDSVAFNIL